MFSTLISLKKEREKPFSLLFDGRKRKQPTTICKNSGKRVSLEETKKTRILMSTSVACQNDSRRFEKEKKSSRREEQRREMLQCERAKEREREKTQIDKAEMIFESK